MRSSEKFLEIVKALCSAQGEFESAEKNAVNPHFKSKYTDYAELWKAVKPALQKYGLLVVFTPSTADSGEVVMNTRIVHASSGEWIECEMRCKPLASGPQPMGSVLTYLKRYTLQSLLALPSEDDDGNAASAAPSAKAQAAKERVERTREALKTAPAPAKEGITKDTVFVLGNGDHEKFMVNWLQSKNVAESYWTAVGARMQGQPFVKLGDITKSVLDGAQV